MFKGPKPDPVDPAKVSPTVYNKKGNNFGKVHRARYW
jgi:hypothetical protein